MSDELHRAWDFVARGDMGGPRRERSSFGTAVFDDALPLRQDSNYLRVEVDDLDADELVAEADRLGLKSILFMDANLGERLVAPFPEGWIVHHGIVMAHRRAPERLVDTSSVEGGRRGLAACRAARADCGSAVGESRMGRPVPRREGRDRAAR